jgi:release factor glutamine methyltransferase
MTRGDWLRKYRSSLPSGEALLILSSLLHQEKAALLAHPEYILSQREVSLLGDAVARRKKNEPIAYITGEKEFFGLPFFVTPATLIPRPETEMLVECVLDDIPNVEDRILEKKISIIDIGTGSGCIPISIATTIRKKYPHIFPFLRFLATDISPEALAIAANNAKRHGMDVAISFQRSDLLSEIPDAHFHSPCSILTANLPYLSKDIYDTSPEDVRDYEPKDALQGDTGDGTILIRKLLHQYIEKHCPAEQYLLILEISPEQGISLLEYGARLFPRSRVRLMPDLSGRSRFLIIENE